MQVTRRRLQAAMLNDGAKNLNLPQSHKGFLNKNRNFIQYYFNFACNTLSSIDYFYTALHAVDELEDDTP